MSASLFRSLLSNWIGLFVAGIVGLIISPIIVHSLGKQTYGSWTLIVSLTGQLIILDFGIRNSLVAFVSRARAKNDTEVLSRTLSTALTLLTVIAVFAFAAVALVAPFVSRIFSLEPDTTLLFQALLLIYTFDAALELIFGIFNGALAGSERYDVMNALNSARVIANAVLVVILLRLGFGVMGIALVALITRVIQRFGLCCYTYRANRGLRIEYRLWDPAIAKSIGKYGSWAFVIVLATRVIYQSDLIIIGIFLGTESIAVYAIALIIVEQLRTLTQSANTILTPRLSGLQVGNRIDDQFRLIEKWSLLSLIITVTIAVPLFVNASAFFDLWMGIGFQHSARILCILICPFFLTAPSLALSSFLYATSQHALAARIQISEALFNLGLSVVLVHYLGLEGVALGTVIPALLCTGILLPLITCSRMKLPYSRFLKLTFFRVAIVATVYALLLVGAKSIFGVTSWLGFVLSNGIPFIIFAAIVYLLFLDSEDRQYLLRRLARD